MDAESPFYYPSLMMRYNAGDETLTDEDYHYLYYGYAYQESYKPLDSNPDLDKLLLMASGLDPDKPAVETLEAMLYTGEDALARESVQPQDPQPDGLRPRRAGQQTAGRSCTTTGCRASSGRSGSRETR